MGAAGLPATRRNPVPRYVSDLIFIILFLFSSSGPLFAQITLSVEADSSPEYLAVLGQLFDTVHRIAPATIMEEGPLLRVTPDGTVHTDSGVRLSSQDLALAESAKRLFSLYHALGGQAGERALFLQRTRNGLFLAREGMAGSLSPTADAAMGSALRSLAAADSSLPTAAREWLPQLAASFEHPDLPPPPFPVARIAPNQQTLITLSGPEIARAGSSPILAGPPGSRINIIKSEAGRLQAEAIFPETINDGFAKLYLFPAGDRLTPVASFDVSVGTASGQGRAAPPDEHNGSTGNAVLLLPPGATRAHIGGQIRAANDVELYALRVSQPGTLAIRSHGSSDVTAQLMDGHGNPVASNDDDGDGYNFGIQSQVSPGKYMLSVRHCCGGGGNYQIDTVLTPK